MISFFKVYSERYTSSSSKICEIMNLFWSYITKLLTFIMILSFPHSRFRIPSKLLTIFEKMFVFPIYSASTFLFSKWALNAYCCDTFVSIPPKHVRLWWLNSICSSSFAALLDPLPSYLPPSLPSSLSHSQQLWSSLVSSLSFIHSQHSTAVQCRFSSLLTARLLFNLSHSQSHFPLLDFFCFISLWLLTSAQPVPFRSPSFLLSFCEFIALLALFSHVSEYSVRTLLTLFASKSSTDQKKTIAIQRFATFTEWPLLFDSD